MDKIDKDNSSSSGVTFVECYVRSLLLADDLGLLNSNNSDLQCALNRFSDARLDAGMKISMAKTKILHSSGNWKDVEGTLSQDMSTLSAYLQTWRLKLSHTKTVTAAFHLNNREAKRELKVYNNGRLLPFCPTPTYLGLKLERSHTFRYHLVALRKKTILARHTAEATRGIGMECWC